MTGPHTQSSTERSRTHRAAMKQIDRRKPESVLRRNRLEADPAAWLQHYMPGAFSLDWSKGHHAMIDGAISASRSGMGVAVAAPRGEGKTTVLRGVCLYLMATKVCRFPLMAGWTHKSAKAGFKLWLNALHLSPELHADYPELTQPFEESIHNGRLKTLEWSDTGAECGAEVNTVDRCIVLPDSIGAIAAASVQGDVKGLSVTLLDGSVIRPDLLLIDDAQDPKRAGNPAFVADVVETIEKQWMCLAGPQSRITTMVACTVAEKEDVSEHFLARPDFNGVRVARVESWPSGWDEKGSKSRSLWDEWHAELLDGLKDDKDSGLRGRRFYRANKDALTAGMKVSWSQRYDKERKDPDAMYSAMFDFYRIGESAFASEYQNEPLKQGATIYNLTPELIQSRADQDRPAFIVPDWSKVCIVATDCNHYGLHSVSVAFGNDQTAAVPWYGCYDGITVPINAPEQERRAIIFEMLVRHGKEIAELQCKPSLWIIDGGYEHDTIQKYARANTNKIGVQIVVARGYASDKYKPWGKNVIGRPREECHHAQWPLGNGLAWNADYWREVSQRAWLGNIGSPGSCSLFAGNHREFCEQVARERLGEKLEGRMGFVWRWITPPGKHDYGDSMAMAYAGAAYFGIGSGRPDDRPVKKQQKRRVRHVHI